MKKIYLSILIFIILFFVFNKESYADGSFVFDTYMQDGTHNFDFTVSWEYDGTLIPVYFRYMDAIGVNFFNPDINRYVTLDISNVHFYYNGSLRTTIYRTGPYAYGFYFNLLYSSTSNPPFCNRSAYYCVDFRAGDVPVAPSRYDDNIGALMNLDMSIVYKLSSGVQARLNWNMPDNVDHVKLVISGTKQTNTYDLTGLSYWFNLSDYGNLDDTVHVYLTPYDSDENWGNTMTISTVVDPVISSYLAQSYKGYYRRVTNPAGSGYVDIIGTSDIDVDVIVEKPDSSGSVPGSPNIVRNYHSYSPVFEYNTINENYYQEVINYYVTNNNVVNNYYDTTINNIDLSTSITVDYDAYFDIDNVTQTCEDIKDEIHQTGNDFSDLFSLFDVVCPFFGGVGAKAFTLFKWVVGIVGGFVGIKILKAFL